MVVVCCLFVCLFVCLEQQQLKNTRHKNLPGVTHPQTPTVADLNGALVTFWERSHVKEWCKASRGVASRMAAAPKQSIISHLHGREYQRSKSTIEEGDSITVSCSRNKRITLNVPSHIPHVDKFRPKTRCHPFSTTGIPTS